ncbi:hypothetical protein COSO111634_25075 [Corallococcus soli]
MKVVSVASTTDVTRTTCPPWPRPRYSTSHRPDSSSGNTPASVAPVSPTRTDCASGMASRRGKYDSGASVTNTSDCSCVELFATSVSAGSSSTPPPVRNSRGVVPAGSEGRLSSSSRACTSAASVSASNRKRSIAVADRPGSGTQSRPRAWSSTERRRRASSRKPSTTARSCWYASESNCAATASSNIVVKSAGPRSSQGAITVRARSSITANSDRASRAR